MLVAGGRDPGKVERTGGAVDECGPEQQHGGAEPADDQILERCLEPAEPVAIDRAEDVERDREPFQREEQGHQVVRADEEHHPASRRREERVVLADVILPPALAIRDGCCEQPRARDDDRGQLREAVTAGHAESARRHATSGTTTPSSAGRRSSAASDTAAPMLRWRIADTRRSTYAAASTIATAPTTDQPQPCRNTPARTRNSPANPEESGTASAITPVVSSTVARAGRPRAMPPSRASSPVSVRRSTIPASRNSVLETRPWLTIRSTEPSRPRSLTEKTPIVISPICARDEYAITPRMSGARNASNEP